MPTKTRLNFFPRLVMERPDIALCRVSTLITRAAELQGHANNVGANHHLVLKMLVNVGPCSQQTLSEELRIDRSVMVGIADDLQKAGYVSRERNPDDRRAYQVDITGAGKTALLHAESSVPKFLNDVFAALTAAERDQLTKILAKVLEID
ncbi:DNA-binding MarR family transcriptional regulator [Saccharothrix tamanrassetensis]|uniref:DNA-binding MarR family transcriptional regulator n=1 Tax=Saccharothrix tamanrassetensis TaxID=1051531 RepID=A0A841CNU0_9PSEU|nr:MarR family transcriptional regulator [Saccharothrix tamanrassetensis]MBB5958969.1 DNA-binding MarR family transcriptional regulator [Saccharothrix tamanrassetensis]